MAEPFLRFLARTFVNKTDLADYCFVFPNRRSGKFFEKELAETERSLCRQMKLIFLNRKSSRLKKLKEKVLLIRR